MQPKITVAVVVLTTLATLSCSRLQQNSSRFDADGTAHVQRVIPVPPTVRPEAQKWLASLADRKPGPDSLAAIRTATDDWRKKDSSEARSIYPVNVQETSVAGVRTDIITPITTPEPNQSRVLINLHGGGLHCCGRGMTRNWWFLRHCRMLSGITSSCPRRRKPCS